MMLIMNENCSSLVLCFYHASLYFIIQILRLVCCDFLCQECLTIKLENKDDALAVQEPEEVVQGVEGGGVVKMVLDDVVGLLLEPVGGGIQWLISSHF